MKLTKITLCLLVMFGLFTQSILRAQDNPACQGGDIECQAGAYAMALTKLRNGVANTNSSFSDYLAYLSTKFQINLRFDGNGQDLLRGLYPKLAQLIEQDVARNFGLSLPLRAPGGGAVQGLRSFIAATIGDTGLAVYLGDLFEQRLNTSFIDALAQDIRMMGSAAEPAHTEALYQFTNFIQTVMDFVSIAQNSADEIRTVIDLNYYRAWQTQIQLARAERRDAMATLRASVRGPDNGRSYMDWVSRQSGNGWACLYLRYVPGHDEIDPNTGTTTHYPPTWTCDQ